ncbi:hypothetical protein E2C01_090543 [Portunus trituberculatus]|uniref:Uncharacterized protein n=1 Tax=Portunus trituberculatus TaxID=210409 RepID=A0A5B7JM19_PORTR|nr:hypothetical protein [Portunus trituberculatus]
MHILPLLPLPAIPLPPHHMRALLSPLAVLVAAVKGVVPAVSAAIGGGRGPVTLPGTPGSVGERYV